MQRRGEWWTQRSHVIGRNAGAGATCVPRGAHVAAICSRRGARRARPAAGLAVTTGRAARLARREPVNKRIVVRADGGGQALEHGDGLCRHRVAHERRPHEEHQRGREEQRPAQQVDEHRDGKHDDGEHDGRRGVGPRHEAVHSLEHHGDVVKVVLREQRDLHRLLVLALEARNRALRRRRVKIVVLVAAVRHEAVHRRRHAREAAPRVDDLEHPQQQRGHSERRVEAEQRDQRPRGGRVKRRAPRTDAVKRVDAKLHGVEAELDSRKVFLDLRERKLLAAVAQHLAHPRVVHRRVRVLQPACHDLCVLPLQHLLACVVEAHDVVAVRVARPHVRLCDLHP
mmetsp:Transcript_40785/g.121732  ORF Transcript_40785/g.121732 Transcript_40785/m.121732 type:complete len:341 (+) Transcript_40785:1114-2136(+)